jgi:hypothetical protein
MKVLKKGRAQKGWATETVCTGNGNGGGGCEAKLLVEEGDLYRTESHCRDETDVYSTFMCTECKVETDLPDRVVPNQVREKLPSKRRWLEKKSK